MLPIALESLTFADLRGMVDAGLREGRTLDFKRELPGGRDDDKREFLADISAFANTVGGDLVFGVDEAQGEATGIPGVTVADTDAECGRLEAILRTGLEPRLARHGLRWLEGPAGERVLVCRVPQSFAAPHRVIFRDHAKFYARGGTGKYPMDVSELRTAFLSADTMIQNIRKFRLDRLALIEAGEGAMTLDAGAVPVLHIVPLSSFALRNDIKVDEYDAGLVPPRSPGGFDSRYTLEGHVSYAVPAANGSVCSYVLLFRSGVIEVAFNIGARSAERSDAAPYVPASTLEWSLLQRVPAYLAMLSRHNVEPPLYLMLSLLGVRGHRLVYGEMPSRRVNRDRMLVPEVRVDDLSAPWGAILHPIFDMVWNGFGFPRALTFDAEGAYHGAKF